MLWRRLVAVIVTLFGALPLLIASPAPLQDWPNHIAETYVLDELLQGSNFWGQFYEVGSFFIPDIILELAQLMMMRLGGSALTAGQVMIVVVYVTFLAGFCALCRSLDSFDLFKLPVATILFYNGAFFWGLLSYLFGIGMMLLCLGLSIASRDHPLRRHMIAAAGSVILFFCHLVASVAFVILLGVFDALALLRNGGSSWRRLSPTAASTLTGLLVVLLLLFNSAAFSKQPQGFVYVGDGTMGAFAHWKLRCLVTILFGGGLTVDVLTALAVIAFLPLALFFRCRFDLTSGLMAGSSLLMAILAPERIGAGSLLDYRLSLLPFILVPAALRISWQGKYQPGIAFGVMVSIALVHSAAVSNSWWIANADYAAFRRDMGRLRPGSIILMAFGRPHSSIPFEDFWALPTWTIEAQAAFVDVFVPSMYANPSQRPMALRNEFFGLGEPLDLSRPEPPSRTTAMLRSLCDASVGSIRFTAVYIIVSYPGSYTKGLDPTVVIANRRSFQILDGCALLKINRGL